MPLQILSVRLDGMTAGDYLAWCRDADPPALDFALRSISVDADPLGDTITATLDWNQALPTAQIAATAAGLPVVADVTVKSRLGYPTQARMVAAEPESLEHHGVACAPGPYRHAAFSTAGSDGSPGRLSLLLATD